MSERVKVRVRILAFLALASLLELGRGMASLDEAQLAQGKFIAIEQGAARPGSTVSFSSAELNSWAQVEAKLLRVDGVRSMRLEFGESRASGFAQVDFLKLRQSSGDSSSYLMRQLLAGERPVSLVVRFQSRNGQARVDVERLEISGIPLEGVALDFLMGTYVRVMFPDAKVGEWFALDRHVETFVVHQKGVEVRIRDPRVQMAYKPR